SRAALGAPAALARLALSGLAPAAAVARLVFRAEPAAALYAGCAAHSFLPLGRPLTSGFALVLLALGHAVGWPAPAGGAQRLADALAEHLRQLGGVVETGREVRSLRDLPAARAVLLDLTPRQATAVAGDAFPPRYRRRLARWRYGPAAFKVDYALHAPPPWRAPACARAAVVHVGGSWREIAHAEAEVARGRAPERPFVLVGQPTVADPGRAPSGAHVLWAYTHVPLGWRGDATAAIEAQLERFAPGFGEVVRTRRVLGPAELEAGNANLVGGDIAGGSHGGLQLLARPTLTPGPYRTPNPRIFLCSASTPPGAGVHGMCGHQAALAALAGPLRD
ncbi:MAG: phytoene desaturase family protein, partial [Acidimicrobiales bacterium]